MQAEEYASLGTTKFENKDYQGAIACFDAALQLDLTNGTALFGKGVAYYHLGDRKAAEAALTAAIPYCPSDPAKVFVTILLGDTKLGNGDNQGATACYDAALQIDPSLGAAYFGKGLISYNLGDDKAAEDALSAAIRLCPDTGIFSNLIEVAAAYALRCTSRLNLNDRKGAWEDYKKVFSLDKQLAREIRILAQTCVGTSQLFVYFTMYPAQATMILRFLVIA